MQIPLLKIPPYFARPTGWTIKDYLRRKKDRDEKPSLFKCKSVRGWWPFMASDGAEAVCYGFLHKLYQHFVFHGFIKSDFIISLL